MRKLTSIALTLLLLAPLTAVAQDTPGTVKFPTSVDSADSLIRATNSARSTLSGGITNSATTITVVSTASFPASGAAMIDNEIVFYTAKTSTQLTGVTRGADSTTAASHSSGAAVRGVITAAHHNTLASAVIATQNRLGAGASTPAAGTVLRGSGPGASTWGTLTSGDMPASPTFTGNVGVGGDLTVTGAINGNGSALTGIGVGTSTGHSAAGSVTVAADTDSNGSGIIDFMTRLTTRFRIHNDGVAEFFHPFKLPGYYNVRAYGAAGDGVTDDSSAVAAAVAAYNADGGGVLHFPKGRYKTAGGYTISEPGTIRGDGDANARTADASNFAYVSRVDCTSATASLFTITALHARVESIALVNKAATTPTAGAGIVVTTPNLPTPDTNYHFNAVDYESVYVNGFFDNIDSQSGIDWTMNNGKILNPRRHGIRIRNLNNEDGGDWNISNTIFSTGEWQATGHAILVESSGGGKVTNCKINGEFISDPAGNAARKSFLDGIHIDLTNPFSTGIFLVSNTSIENVRGDGIYAEGIHLLVIGGMEFGLYGNASGNLVHFNNVREAIVDNVVAQNSVAANIAFQIDSSSDVRIGKTAIRDYSYLQSYSVTYTDAPSAGGDGFNTLTLAGAWAAATGWGPGGGTSQPAVGKFDGWVVVRGMVSGSTPNSTITTLPLGFKPTRQLILPVYTDGVPGFLLIEEDGDIKQSGAASAAYQSLEFMFRP